ncbi:MAG: hypothetical protein NTW21_07555 [Verrucomicrobia bacterium]|nr:hypothetical protein [Verrucomicrobiota bacterium]
MKPITLLLASLFATAALALAEGVPVDRKTEKAADTPEYTGPDDWPAMMAHVELQNAGLINNDDVVSSPPKVIRIASEKIGEDLYRQVHLITFKRKSGQILKVMTVNNVSSVESSKSAVDVYIISAKYSTNSLKVESYDKATEPPVKPKADSK